jgi:hypothetical protein
LKEHKVNYKEAQKTSNQPLIIFLKIQISHKQAQKKEISQNKLKINQALTL